MATAKIWWHQAPAPASFGDVPLVVEPEISFETVNTATAASTGSAPHSATAAVVFATVRTYYRVLKGGVGDDADSANCKFCEADKQTHISVAPGDKISFIE